MEGRGEAIQSGIDIQDLTREGQSSVAQLFVGIDAPNSARNNISGKCKHIPSY